MSAETKQETKAPYVYHPDVCEEWNKNIDFVMFTEEQIKAKVRELGAKITEDYKGKKPVMVGLLTGAFVFYADLLRTVALQYEVDFMVVSSYGSATTTSGSIKMKKDMSIDPHGRDILIIEDLIDTGHTLKWLLQHFALKGANSVNICCLLDKKSRRSVQVDVKYVGFECPDYFIVGYGMDFANEYRCLPFIAVLKPEAYASVASH